jgi:hypothetical protein
VSKVAKPGEAGGTCGGSAGIGCKAGLRCELAASHPDASGVCALDNGKSDPPPVQCQAIPACDPGTSAVESCAAKDDTCTTKSMCGRTIHCQASKSVGSSDDLDGKWGADQATLSFDNGKGTIEFGCGAAELEDIVFSNATDFTATGVRQPGSGVEFPPGMGPKPEPATFKGTLSGKTLKLDMTVAKDTTKMTFTRDRDIQLFHCL